MFYKQNGLKIAESDGVILPNRQAVVDGVTYTSGWPLKTIQQEIRESAGIEEAEPAKKEPKYKTEFTSLEFFEKFKEDEQLAVVSATLQNANVKLWYDKMLGANGVNVSDPRTIAGLEALVGAGLLTAERQAEILQPELIS